MLAVLADGRDVIAVDRHADARLRAGIDVEDLLALARRGDHLVLGHHEAVPRGGADQELAAGLVHEHLDEVVVLLEIDHQAYRLAVAAAAGQLARLQREELAVGREHAAILSVVEALMRPFQAVALLELELREIVLVALQGADPALVGQDHRDRLLLDHRLVEVDVDRRAHRRIAVRRRPSSVFFDQRLATSA